ncbi:hypothetical protein TRIUR3_10389 [Triticum urartu]|uniref:Uncharacterized protein n=1 Tax=Triticum urartu TaxID=4572 RepID=M7ZZJ6_TRIUA|nr:hypothetical protein TRIUR3_10389 [Triticum urartu]
MYFTYAIEGAGARAPAPVRHAPARLIEKDAGPECILRHTGAVVHGRLGVQRWEQPGRRMSPLREEPSRETRSACACAANASG